MKSKQPHIKTILLLLLFLLAAFCNAYAAPIPAISFDVSQANRTLDQINIKLSIEDVNVKNLGNASALLSDLQDKAKECVKETQADLNKINEKWEETQRGIKTGAELTSAQKYLKNKRDKLKTRRSECRLFALRSDEAIAAFTATAKKLSKKELLKITPNFFEEIVSIKIIVQEFFNTFDTSLLYKESGLKQLFYFVPISILIVLLLFGIISNIKLKKIFTHYEETKALEKFSDKMQLTFVHVFKKYSLALILPLMVALVSTIRSIIAGQASYLMLGCYAAFLYASSLLLIQLLFYPYYEKRAICGLGTHIAYPLVNRLKILATICLFGFVFYVLFHNQPYSKAATGLSRTIFITFFTLSLMSILWLVTRISFVKNKRRILSFFLSFLLTCLLTAIVVTEWLGYENLVNYILINISLTLLLSFSAFLIHKIITATLRNLSIKQLPLQKGFRQYLGYKKTRRMPEITFFVIMILTFLWSSFVVLLLNIWGDFSNFTNWIVYGFKTNNITIIPSRILFSFLFFISLLISIRFLKTFVEICGEKYAKGENIYLAWAAILNYIGISIALLISLLVAGINFAGLAIIAGALSVGIGFGLQNIVNNFLSGIILLIERPIKPGDRVAIGDVEGYVKKISIRSTQIETISDRSDIIVPNALLISEKVTNLMFRDFYGKISIHVGVAYGSDTELVKKTLLEVAHAHPEIVKDDPLNLPIVLFREFGDHSLKFILFCLIRNVNLKYMVLSELHFALEKAFKENNIVIAFPQQDLHIKDWTKDK